ncbi:PHP domain-containing protein [Alistipes timonensis]
MKELIQWLDANKISFQPVDKEVVAIDDFGRMYCADLAGVESIFKVDGDRVRFNLPEDAQVLLDEGIRYVAFPFGDKWYYYDLGEEFRFNLLKYIGSQQPCRYDIPFVNLGIHTPYELLNGSGALADWARKAQYLRHTALGICDRNTLAATLNLQKVCEDAGLRPIFGYTLTMEHEGERIDLKVYALSQQGLAGLLRIQKEVMVDSDAHTLSYEQLLAYGEGCALVFGVLAADWMVLHPHEVEALKSAFGMTFYQVDLAEYKADRIDRQGLMAVQTFFRNFYDPVTGSFAVEPILISDCYYLDRDDARNKIVLNKISTGAAHAQSEDQYFKDVDEHAATLQPLFREEWDFDTLFRRMCLNTIRIAEAAEAHFETGRMFMPRYMMRDEEKACCGDRRTLFRRLLDEGLTQKIPAAEHARYRERLNEEVYIIESTDNVDYFLIQWDMVCEARRRGIAVGIGRGSAGGSLVAYLLGITSLDPMRYGLLFSRFLVPERCGLSWCDELTVIAEDVPLKSGERYVEIEASGSRYRLHPDAQLRILRNDVERTIYADELTCGDEILFDRRDCLWTLKELEVDDRKLQPHST